MMNVAEFKLANKKGRSIRIRIETDQKTRGNKYSLEIKKEDPLE